MKALPPGAVRVQVSIRGVGMIYSTVEGGRGLLDALRTTSDGDVERIAEALRIVSRDHLDGFEIGYVDPAEVAALAWLSRAALDDALKERVSRALEQAALEGLSVSAVHREIGGQYDDMRAALGALERGGYVEVEDGPRGAKLHFSVQAYRAEDVPEGVDFEEA